MYFKSDYMQNVTIKKAVIKDNQYLNVEYSEQQKDEDDYYTYPKMDQLQEELETCIDEVLLYLFEGKHAPENQLQMAFEAIEENV